LADEWLTDNAREESGRRPVRLTGTHTNRGQANTDTVKEALARVIRQKEFVDRLLRPVGGQRRRDELVVNATGIGAPKTPVDDVNTTRGLYAPQLCTFMARISSNRFHVPVSMPAPQSLLLQGEDVAARGLTAGPAVRCIV
jgi:hypothetical protein